MTVGEMTVGISPGGTDGVVVVGTGIAGVSAVAALRSAGFDGPVRMVGDDPELPYRRPTVSKELVRGDKAPDQVRIKPEAWYADQGVDLVTGRVLALDPAGRSLSVAGGPPVRYDLLLLATGGRARSPWRGDRVHTLRSAGDAAALRGALADVDRVLVVGAGLVGSEVAASLRSLGHEVTLLETAPLPLPRLLPDALAQRYVALHKTNGTELETGVTVSALRETAAGVEVSAADGRRWTAGLVVVAVGMEPESELAAAAGLRTEGGVVVDWAGRTSAPGVFAAGDVALRPTSFTEGPEGFGRFRGEHWQAAQNHGAAVGRAMAGEEVVFDEVPWSWSDQYGVNLQVTGWPDPADDLVLRGSLDADAFTAFFVRQGVLRGAVTIGRPADVRAARALVAGRSRVSLALLADPDVPVGETVES